MHGAGKRPVGLLLLLLQLQLLQQGTLCLVH